MDEQISKDYLKNKHILAIDYGQKFTGLASYKVGNDPYPLAWGRLAYENDTKLLSDINTIIEDEFIDIIVVGVPHFTDGTESTMTKTIKNFVKNLDTSTECDVRTIDETLTTFEAEERMKNDPRYNFKVDMRKIDELCAAIILEQFLKNSSN
jgi:putative Holliday junction resolvase